MSDANPPTSGTQQPSEAEIREYVAKLRAAPAEQVVTDVLAVLLQAAEVKLGRRDARLLIDLVAIVLDHSRPHLPDQLASQVDQTLGQLRLGQVQAENAPGGNEENDLATTPQPFRAPTQPAAATSTQPPQTSKLWIPGRG